LSLSKRDQQRRGVDYEEEDGEEEYDSDHDNDDENEVPVGME